MIILTFFLIGNCKLDFFISLRRQRLIHLQPSIFIDKEAASHLEVELAVAVVVDAVDLVTEAVAEAEEVRPEVDEVLLEAEVPPEVDEVVLVERVSG